MKDINDDDISDIHVFTYVYQELDDKIKIKDLWNKAFAMAEAEPTKTKALYIKYRVQQIKKFYEQMGVDIYKEEIRKLKRVQGYQYSPDWMKKLWIWADNNNIAYGGSSGGYDPNHIELYYWGLERRGAELNEQKILFLGNCLLQQVPDELSELTQIEAFGMGELTMPCCEEEAIEEANEWYLELNPDQISSLTELPRMIVNLKNLKLLDIRSSKGITLTYKQEIWITQLKANGCHVYR